MSSLVPKNMLSEEKISERAEKWKLVHSTEPDGEEGRAVVEWFSYMCAPQTLYFFGALLYSLEVKRSPIGTFAVALDQNPTKEARARSPKKYFYWDPRPVRALENVKDPDSRWSQIEFVMVHESCHILLRHFSRYYFYLASLEDGQRELAQKFFNMCADYEVNHYALRNKHLKERDLDSTVLPVILSTDMDMPRGRTFEEYMDAYLDAYEDAPNDLLDQLMEMKGMKKGQEREDEPQKDKGEDEQKGQGSDPGDSGDQGSSGDPGGDENGGEGTGGSGETSSEQHDGGSGQGSGSPSQESGGGAASDYSDRMYPNLAKASDHGANALSKEEAQQGIKEIMGIDPEDRSPIPDAHILGRTAEDLNGQGKYASNRDYQVVSSAVKKMGQAPGAKGRGIVPGDIRQLIEDMAKSIPIPWDQMLEKRMKTGSLGGRELSMSHFHKGKAALLISMRRNGSSKRPCIHPGYGKVPQPRIEIAVDTSGSMSEHELMFVIDIVTDLTQRVNGQLTVVMFDTRIHDVFDVFEGAEVTSRGFSGRGGTDFNCVFKRAQEESQPDVFIVFTDGCAPMPEEDVRIAESNVIWLITPNNRPPWESGWRNREDDVYGESIIIEEYGM